MTPERKAELWALHPVQLHANEIDEIKTALSTAERERDTALRERDEARAERDALWRGWTKDARSETWEATQREEVQLAIEAFDLPALLTALGEPDGR